MSEHQSGEDPEPSQPARAGALFVPVRSGSAGFCVRLFRTPLGGRTAVAFTSEGQLAATLGPQQTWIRLSEHAVRALIAPLGVTTLTLDPQLAAPAPAAVPAPANAPVTAPVTVSVPVPSQSAAPYGVRRPSLGAVPPAPARQASLPPSLQPSLPPARRRMTPST